jgi:hypothetical protein
MICMDSGGAPFYKYSSDLQLLDSESSEPIKSIMLNEINGSRGPGQSSSPITPT